MKNIRAVSTLLLASLLAASALARDDALNRVEATVQAELDSIVADQGIPGAVVCVILPEGDEIWLASGLADKEAAHPMAPADRMLAASIGKSFVATMAVALSQDGLLDLDAPISTWLGDRDWFAGLPAGESITTRMLLNHSSGLSDYVYQPGYLENRRKPDDPDWYLPHEDKIRLIVGKESRFEPGTGFYYTDSEYLLVGFIIETVTGRPYYELLQERFLGPFRLDLTSPSNRRQLDGLVPGYMSPNDPFGKTGLPARVVENGLMLYNPASEWTGGGVITNPRDLARWARLLYEGDVLSKPYVEEMRAPAIAEPLKLPWQHYGLATMTFDTPHGPLLGHWGNMPGYSGLMVYAPRQKISFSMLANTTLFDTGLAQSKLFDAILKAIPVQD